MISFGDNSFIRYTYSATGEKLGVRYGMRFQPLLSPVGQSAQLTGNGDAAGTMQDRSGDFDPGIPGTIAVDAISYCGNVVYDCGTTRLLTDEGYVTFAADGTPQYHYYLKDHLGNIRVVMGQTGELEQVNHYYAYGGLMRESTNPGVQPYKYGGKELDRTSGLDAYDFGARMYFADRMQWGQVDPMCEKYYDVSPYGYCFDNPVRYADPDGRGPWETFIFALKHPTISAQIGSIQNNGINISSIASRFAGIGKTEENSNAIRHTVWQAIITKAFGSKIAKEVGDAHEINPNTDLSQMSFNGPNAKNESDQVVDLLNNNLGREIGETYSGSIKSLVATVLNYFSKEGLYVSVENKSDNTFHVIRKKISQGEKKLYSRELDSRDEKGFTKEEIKGIKMNNQLKETLEMAF